MNFNEKDEKRNYLCRYLKRIFYLYLVWQIIYLPFFFEKILNYERSNISITAKWSKFIWRFIFPGYGYTPTGRFIPGTNGWGVSWYLIGLIMGLPLFCLVIKYIKNNYIISLICSLLEGAYICSSGYHFFTNFYMWGILTFLRLFIYLYVGYLISQNFNKISSLNFITVGIVTIIFIILFLSENIIVYKFNGNPMSEELITTVPTSTLIVIFALKFNPQWRCTVLIRNYSTFFYTSQVLFLYLIGLVPIFSGVTSGYFKLLMTIILSFICFRIYIIICKKAKWKFLKYVV